MKNIVCAHKKTQELHDNPSMNDQMKLGNMMKTTHGYSNRSPLDKKSGDLRNNPLNEEIMKSDATIR